VKAVEIRWLRQALENGKLQNNLETTILFTLSKSKIPQVFFFS
jgi:hypothetical protein